MIETKENLSEKIKALSADPRQLITFLKKIKKQIQHKPEKINPTWKKFEEINYTENKILIGNDGSAHRGVVIVNGNKEEIAFSDLHGDIDGLNGLLENVLCQLNCGGVVIANGDNITKINDQQKENHSFVVLLALLLLMKEYPLSFFALLGNHEIEDCFDYKNKRDYSVKDAICSYKEKDKKKIGDMLYNEIIPCLPEFSISKETNTVYAHASPPLAEKGELTHLFDQDCIVATKDMMMLARGQSITTHAAGFFDKPTFDLYKKYSNTPIKYAVGHAHYPFSGYKTLTDSGWFFKANKNVVTTHSSMVAIAPTITCDSSEFELIAGTPVENNGAKTVCQQLDSLSRPKFACITSADINLRAIEKSRVKFY